MSDHPRDCPECRSAGSVVRGFCEVCYAELLIPEPAQPLSFAEVVDELQRACDMARSGGGRTAFAAACRRVERLVLAVRAQFLDEVVLSPKLHELSTPHAANSLEPALD